MPLIVGSRINMAMSDAESSGLWVSKDTAWHCLMSSKARAWSVVCGGGKGDCWSSAARSAVPVEGGGG